MMSGNGERGRATNRRTKSLGRSRSESPPPLPRRMTIATWVPSTPQVEMREESRLHHQKNSEETQDNENIRVVRGLCRAVIQHRFLLNGCE